MKISYKENTLRNQSLKLVDKANEIICIYRDQGYTLTLRQIYYQFVSRDLIPNTINSYKRLGNVINEGRLCGLIDWKAIEDRTRSISKLPSWDSPSEIVESCAEQFKIDLWEDQPKYIEVWVEKEALAGIIEQACNEYRVPFLSCRGYTSQSEMWRAGQRLIKQDRLNKEIIILHLGDHDPSGIDMSRDIQVRLDLLTKGVPFTFNRIALNRDQINKYQPPPNPAKMTDTRFKDYEKVHGNKSWELDALEPSVISDLITNNIRENIINNSWITALKREEGYKIILSDVAKEIE